MKNNIPYTLIDTAGQTTAIIDVSVPRKNQPEVAKPIMAKVKNIGQVCFIEKEGRYFRLQMMGNEFSVNGVLAGGNFLLKKLNKSSLGVLTSGLNGKIEIVPNCAYFPKSIVLEPKKNFVDFSGICYYFLPDTGQKNINDKLLDRLTRNRPAAGIVYYKGERIRPLIFVKPLNTYVWETCCGSASIGYSLLTGIKKIKQPSGQFIKVQINEENIIYSARCRML